MYITKNLVPYYFSQIEEYWFHGPQVRFAKDAGISPAAFSRLLRGKAIPRYHTLCRVVNLLEQKLQKRLDLQEVYTVSR